MTLLTTELRNRLKDTVTAARDLAETGSRAALEALGVHHHEPYGHMTGTQRSLRKKLRAHARQLGDPRDPDSGSQSIDRLVCECAYEHWHRMLFARYLAENHLLIEPDAGVAISLEECEELAREEGLDTWALAGRYAEKMLPQIFRPDNCLLQVKLALNHQLPLEDTLKNLKSEIFTASDSLGWVYQFWQTKKKDDVNQAGEKIGADELPAVTQLFTEPYMVRFLIHNTLGAWRFGQMKKEGSKISGETEEALRKQLSLPGVAWDYLRFVKDNNGNWTPAAGVFDQWPDKAAELKIMDPCCGSGHFLVALFNHLVPLRMAEEELSAQKACDAVLADNLHGLELDERCTQIAAFALALAAWQYPGAGGYRNLPQLPVACSGLSVGAAKQEWKQLGIGNKNLEMALGAMHDFFSEAPTLGSLLDPMESEGAGLIKWGNLEWDELAQILDSALTREQGEEGHEAGVAAQGLARSARMLSGRYHWVITNVPYLVRGKQGNVLKTFCERYYKEAKNDLATVFLERCLGLCTPGGATSIVLPQNWLFLTTYKKFRKKLLRRDSWHMIARLGAGAFETISGEVVKAILLVMRQGRQKDDVGLIRGIDASEPRTAREKAELLLAGEIKEVGQEKQLENPDARIALEETSDSPRLEEYAECFAGVLNGDSPRFQKQFWEIVERSDRWTFQQTTVQEHKSFGGLELVLYYDKNEGHLREEAWIRREKLHDSDQRGNKAWGNKGIGISQMRILPVSLYTGETFDSNIAIIYPKDPSLALPIWTYCQSDFYHEEVRRIDQKLNVTNATLVKVPFDLDHWTKVAQEKYPHGIPQPYSNDPTQWIFHGHPCGSVVLSEATKRLENGPYRTDDTVLQVAVARLLGYRWPAETDPEMELADEQREWVKKCDAFLDMADGDGIVPIPSLRGEEPAAERLRQMLARAFASAGAPASFILHPVEFLDDWLRNQFFEAHRKLFQHRPFVWHIWDGRKRDGFHALVNYHKLTQGGGRGRQLLEKLTYGYLGDWIILQKDGVKQGVGGAEDRLTAALELEKRLKAILAGEPPFDIFVRWKPLHEQPVGWEPDINDGVRLNIRPFMTDDIPGGRAGAGILRWKPNIKWTKDRGKDVSSAPWYNLGPQYGGNDGDRINDHHLTIAEKREARKGDKL